MRTMSPKDARELARLLRKLPKQNFWVPDEAFEPLHGAVSMWAPELVILRKSGREILLTPYKGKFANGFWHIPGGYNTRNETMQETVSRVAKRELGQDVKYVKCLDVEKWGAGEHPYGRPLSVYVLVTPKKALRETKEMLFWNVNRLPKKMIHIHRRFVRRVLQKSAR